MKEYHKNPRRITPKQLEQLKANIQELGDLSGIVHDLNTDEIISGNQRSKVIDINKCEVVLTEKYDNPNPQGTVAWGYVVFEGQKLNYRQVRWDERQREKANITANALGGDWDYDILEDKFDSMDLVDWGLTKLEEHKVKKTAEDHASLFDKFVIPPFSILDTRQGYWQDRKKQWKAIIGGNGETRQDTNMKSPELKYKTIYERSKVRRLELGITFAEYLDRFVSEEEKRKAEAQALGTGTSMFDPVLAEIIVRWFSYPGSRIIDPFAGDVYKGLVFGYLGHNFTGIEIRPEQIEENNKILQRFPNVKVNYINDDGQNVADHFEENSVDLVISCPPYFDLEHYSDLPNDASNAPTYEAFLKILENGFAGALKCLRENRFAVVVVGDVRNRKTGFYYDFVGDIKRIFKEHGAGLYNELILIESGASTALRAGKYMEMRKIAKNHQNVLVFYKGEHNFQVNRAIDSRKVVSVNKNVLVFYKGEQSKIREQFKKIEYDSEDMELFGLDK